MLNHLSTVHYCDLLAMEVFKSRAGDQIGVLEFGDRPVAAEVYSKTCFFSVTILCDRV